MRLSEHFPKLALTPREFEVLGLAARGMSNKEIAFKISAATGTVKMHLQSVLRKLGASDRTQAVMIFPNCAPQSPMWLMPTTR